MSSEPNPTPSPVSASTAVEATVSAPTPLPPRPTMYAILIPDGTWYALRNERLWGPKGAVGGGGDGVARLHALAADTPGAFVVTIPGSPPAHRVGEGLPDSSVDEIMAELLGPQTCRSPVLRGTIVDVVKRLRAERDALRAQLAALKAPPLSTSGEVRTPTCGTTFRLTNADGEVVCARCEYPIHQHVGLQCCGKPIVAKVYSPDSPSPLETPKAPPPPDATPPPSTESKPETKGCIHGGDCYCGGDDNKWLINQASVPVHLIQPPEPATSPKGKTPDIGELVRKAKSAADAKESNLGILWNTIYEFVEALEPKL